MDCNFAGLFLVLCFEMLTESWLRWTPLWCTWLGKPFKEYTCGEQNAREFDIVSFCKMLLRHTKVESFMAFSAFANHLGWKGPLGYEQVHWICMHIVK